MGIDRISMDPTYKWPVTGNYAYFFVVDTNKSSIELQFFIKMVTRHCPPAYYLPRQSTPGHSSPRTLTAHVYDFTIKLYIISTINKNDDSSVFQGNIFISILYDFIDQL